MTLIELIDQLRLLADAGYGQAIVCVPESDETACAGDMTPLCSIVTTEFQAPASPDAANGDPAILLI